MAAVAAMGTENKGSLPQLLPSSPLLPCDILREVLARCDHETLVRCAVSSKLLCRCMLDDPAFLHNCLANSFAPSLLLGIFHSTCGGGARFAESPAPAVVRREPICSLVSNNAADLFTRFDELVACRGGLLVLRQDRRTSKGNTVDLCVCNPMTGERCFLSPPVVCATSVAILTSEDEARSGNVFQLLAMDLVCDYDGHDQDEDYEYDFVIRRQLFSSPGSFPTVMPNGTWGPVRMVPVRNCSGAAEGPPVVIGRVAHWLCTSIVSYGFNVFALDFDDDGGSRLIDGPRELVDPRFGINCVLLTSTPDRRLGIVVVEELVISMLVLLSVESGTWERRVVVVREGILLAPPRRIRLHSFGQRSGTVVIGMGCLAGRLLLNLETKELMHMSLEDEVMQGRCHLYEMDLHSLLLHVNCL